MSMDTDLDFTFAPSETIYGARAIMLDPATQGNCYLGGYNALCIGITPQQSEFAPGLTGNNSYPYVLAQVGDNSKVPVYGTGRKCLWDVDPAYTGQIKPNDLCVSSNSGYLRKASPFGPWNQWILARALSFAGSGQSCNVKIEIYPWSPTGS